MSKVLDGLLPSPEVHQLVCVQTILGEKGEMGVSRQTGRNWKNKGYEKHRMRSGKGIRGFVVGHCALVLSRGPEVVSQRHRLCSSLQHGIQLISQVIEHAADVI